MWPDNPEITFVACRRSMPVRRGNCLCFVRLFVLHDYIDLAGIKACEFKIEADIEVGNVIELNPDKLIVPRGILSDLVVGETVSFQFRFREMFNLDDRQVL